MSTIAPEKTAVTAAVGNDEITFETGKLAKQADGAVVVKSGDTMVLATAQGRLEAREGADFFPLTVDVEERMYAAGKIPGGFFKREGRPTEKAILTARMIDRPIRPLWPKGFRNEVQVICTTLSADLVTPHDILAINGASAALMISPLPFLGPVGAVRIGMIEGELVVNPTLPDIEDVRARPDRRRHEGGPDDGRGGRERGARGHAARGLRPRARRDQEALRGAGGAAPPGRQAEVARPRAHGRARERPRRAHLRPRSHADGLREAAAAVEEIVAELCPPITIDSTEEDIVRETQVRSSLEAILERRRLEAVIGAGPRAVRGRAARADRGTSRTRSSSSRRSATCSSSASSRLSSCPSRSGPATVEGEAPDGQGQPHEAVRQEGRRGDLQGAHPPQDRRREAPPRRPRRPTRSGRSPARSRSRRARTARRSSPAARRRS